jgi:hypothetical protein
MRSCQLLCRRHFRLAHAFLHGLGGFCAAPADASTALFTPAFVLPAAVDSIDRCRIHLNPIVRERRPDLRQLLRTCLLGCGLDLSFSVTTPSSTFTSMSRGASIDSARDWSQFRLERTVVARRRQRAARGVESVAGSR